MSSLKIIVGLSFFLFVSSFLPAIDMSDEALSKPGIYQALRIYGAENKKYLDYKKEADKKALFDEGYLCESSPGILSIPEKKCIEWNAKTKDVSPTSLGLPTIYDFRALNPEEKKAFESASKIFKGITGKYISNFNENEVV